MKTEDFERLKKLCDENGFELVTESPDQNDKLFVVKLKDIWEGVEFVEDRDGNVYRFIEVNNFIHTVTFYDKNGDIVSNSWGRYKPSTEEAYIEYLKKEAFERFGKIKKGVVIQDLKGHIVDKWFGIFNYHYSKDTDSLYFEDILIYERGKWAKKIDQPTKVTVSDFSHFGTSVQFKLLLSKWCDKKGTEIGDYLAKCLEDYLNE